LLMVAPEGSTTEPVKTPLAAGGGSVRGFESTTCGGAVSNLWEACRGVGLFADAGRPIDNAAKQNSTGAQHARPTLNMQRPPQERSREEIRV